MSIYEEERLPPEYAARIFSAAKLCFMMAAVAAAALGVLLFLPVIAPELEAQELDVAAKLDRSAMTVFVISRYVPHLLLLLIALVTFLIGYRLVLASGASPQNPIPPANYRLLAPLIEQGRSEAVDQYVRLSSLSGFTGTFTKLGLTGLPLATIALTLIFAVFAVLVSTDGEKNNFMDLAKLTLGAFIGSFVQRQVEQRRLVEAAKPRDQSIPPLTAG